MKTLYSPLNQHTLANSFTCVGRGLHTGLKIVMRVMPGEPNTGYVFVRRDIKPKQSEIVASWNNVSDTRLSTTISNSYGIRVSTVEHLLAALYACNIDNARIVLDGPEVPIMDGSANSFVSLIQQTGRLRQGAERAAVVIKQSVSITDGDKYAGFLPSPIPWINIDIDFDLPHIGKQNFSVPIQEDIFEKDIAPARTFGFKEQINTLHKLGLAQGGTLNNAILIDEDKIINEEGLRFDNELVRHKVLDCIGDLALIGARLVGQFTGRRTGHHLNNQIIHELMLREHSWQYTTLREAHTYWKDILLVENNDRELAREIISKMDNNISLNLDS